MGLFSFVGKAIGGIGKLAVGALRSGLVPLPFGGAAGRILGGLLHAKAPMGHSQLKLQLRSPLLIRGKTMVRHVAVSTPHGARVLATATALRKAKVMPGGAIPHPKGGTVGRPLGLQAGGVPLTASGKPKRKRRRRASGTSRSSSRTYRRSSRRSSHRKRRLKFGSPAWRKKYLGHGRKRRKRRAA